MTTIIDQVQAVWPGVSADTAELLLWETTPFPFASEDAVLTQLKDSYRKFDGNVQLAIDDAYSQINAASAAFKAREDNHGNI